MEDSLLNWVKTFPNLSKPVNTAAELADGIIFSDILEQLIPAYFDSGLIKKEAQNNDFLKISNLRKIVLSLDEFFENELGFPSDVTVDPNVIVKEGDKEEMNKLIQLILAVAIECENKIEYIQNIMKMDSQYQRELMVSIEKIMLNHQKQRGNLSSPSIELNRTKSSENFLSDNDDYRSKFEKLSLQYNELLSEHSIAQSEHEHLISEKNNLSAALKNLEETVTSLQVQKVNEEQNAQKKAEESALEQNFKKEQEKLMNENMKLHEELHEKENLISDQKKKLEENNKALSEARILRDEVDILREKAASVEDLEDRLKKTQKKADAAADLRKQLKAIEEQSEQYLKSNLEHEESAKKLPILKKQIDEYKDQLLHLTAKSQSLKASLDKKENELNQLKKESQEYKSDREEQKNQIRSLKREIEQLKLQSDEQQMSGGLQLDDSVLAGVTDLSVREKLMRLEMENKKLKESGGGENVVMLENKIDDLQRLNTKYSKHIEELKHQLTEDNKADVSVGEVPFETRQELETLKENLKKLEDENRKLLGDYNNVLKEKQLLSEVGNKLSSTSEQITALTNEKTKLEGYLRTAKTMIRDERAKVNGEIEKVQKSYEDVVNSLKNQLKEKEKEISDHKLMIEESKNSSIREQKLMSSALYELGLELQRIRAPKPDVGNGSTGRGSDSPNSQTLQPQSLLAQKRSGGKK
eukprot:TRINITY_DN1998_c0_g1_i1.p1 TRINITY_DN1998_c0_g1~~TRINITY_DN1998_c0_g1_i1.p1  ORF type:complete len:699 (+),score=315.14 TRINITY_DN1998_c0_g1_i1:68-2164(+)